MQRKINWKAEAKAWSQIVIGCFIVAIGFVVFINPYKLVPGGVFGSSIILHQLWPQMQVGTYSYMLQIPLMIITTLLVGKKLGVRSPLRRCDSGMRFGPHHSQPERHRRH